MFREVVGTLHLVSPMSQCNGGRGTHSVRPRLRSAVFHIYVTLRWNDADAGWDGHCIRVNSYT
jgi:hypothetical protein